MNAKFGNAHRPRSVVGADEGCGPPAELGGLDRNANAPVETLTEHTIMRGKKYIRRKTWRAQNREKYLAHKSVENALISGRLKRQPCERCGSMELVHAHHDDYSQRFAVTWLCPAHHIQRHIELGAKIGRQPTGLPPKPYKRKPKKGPLKIRAPKPKIAFAVYVCARKERNCFLVTIQRYGKRVWTRDVPTREAGEQLKAEIIAKEKESSALTHHEETGALGKEGCESVTFPDTEPRDLRPRVIPPPGDAGRFFHRYAAMT